MSLYILVLSLSTLNWGPNNFSVSEFHSKESCEVALNEAKKFWKTIEDQSKCVSVDSEVKKKQLKDALRSEESK